jgi:hypothetical protein
VDLGLDLCLFKKKKKNPVSKSYAPQLPASLSMRGVCPLSRRGFRRKPHCNTPWIHSKPTEKGTKHSPGIVQKLTICARTGVAEPTSTGLRSAGVAVEGELAPAKHGCRRSKGR